MLKKPESTDWQSVEDRFALARHRYLRGLISDAEFYAAHRELREAKANGN
jgi:uncharacterized membrane protein